MFYHKTWLLVITMNFHLISYDEISNFSWLSQAYEQKTVLSNKSCNHLLGGSAISPHLRLENKSNSVLFLPQGKPYILGRLLRLGDLVFFLPLFYFKRGLSVFFAKCRGCPMLMHGKAPRLGNLQISEMILWWDCLLDWYCPWLSLNLRLLKEAKHFLLVLLPYQQGLKCLFLHSDVLIIFSFSWSGRFCMHFLVWILFSSGQKLPHSEFFL